MNKTERRKSDPFFRKAHDFLVGISAKKLQGPEFSEGLTLLSRQLNLFVRVASAFASYSELKDKANLAELGRLADELARLEAELLATKLFKRSDEKGLLLDLVSLREEVAAKLELGQKNERTAHTGKFAKASDGFEEIRFGAAENFDEVFAGSEWENKFAKREAKKKRREERAELLRDLQEQMRKLKERQNQASGDGDEAEVSPFKRASATRRSPQSDGIQKEFEEAKRRASVHQRKTLAWAAAFLGVATSSPLADAKKRYYEYAKRWHPDVHQGEKKHIAEDAMTFLNEAWKVFRSMQSHKRN